MENWINKYRSHISSAEAHRWGLAAAEGGKKISRDSGERQC